MNALYPATLEAAQARLAAVDPAAYARSRNHLEGAVTRLSPYLTHGLLTLPEAYQAIHARTPLEPQGKLVFEFGWREYHHHVWAHLGDRIHASLHAGLHDDASYSADVPEDVRQAATGIPAIDTAVRTLYATGYLHNHARMWLASYLVHIRKVHWHAGAGWMIAHLLDGDLASNHLSWQWVAGTGSTKPYLFNADNVARYAPEPWHSSDTALDTSYEALDSLARSPKRVLAHAPSQRSTTAATTEPAVLTAPPAALGFTVPDARTIAGKDVWLVHPWSLGQRPSEVPVDALCIAVLVADFHQRNPWSALRWNFVGERMAAMTNLRWFADAETLGAALKSAHCVHMVEDLHLASFQRHLQAVSHCSHSQPLLFEPVEAFCPSFSSWWKQTRVAVCSL
ncbi:MAG: FAD-binding domain-containing protein [Rhodoferax sp.]|nr:FAD-binding domain-containing protein [Rhodoferax sp.]